MAIIYRPDSTKQGRRAVLTDVMLRAQYQLCDGGVSYRSSGLMRDAPVTIVGTTGYIAPEVQADLDAKRQFGDPGTAQDCRMDIWTLAITFSHLL